MLGLFDGLEDDDITDEPVLRAPFGYVGSKTKSLKHILPMLPYGKSYIEVFGGSGVVLLNRRASKLDVYNDRFGGVVCFYRCLRDPAMFDELTDWLENTVHAKEEYIECRATWKDCHDPVERAARWYYSMAYSFGSKGDAWGRTVNSAGMAGQIRRKIAGFDKVHRRLESVQFENASWEKILRDYDNSDAVFYLDPPYVATDSGGYHYAMNHDDHRKMLNYIQGMEGFVALSGFSNPLYDDFQWDDRISWNVTCTMAGNSNTEGNGKAHMKGLEGYHSAEEILWIKEAR